MSTDKEAFYLYRLPLHKDIIFGSGKWEESVGEANCENGFVIAPFSNPEAIGMIKPAERQSYSGIKDFTANFQDFIVADIVSGQTQPDSISPDMNRSQHAEYINTIQAVLSEAGGGKIVASVTRTLPFVNTKSSLKAFFSNLCRQYPGAFVFIIHTPVYGTWIGASPELLLQRSNNDWRTVSLAGTRLVDTKENWDKKNIEEQLMVTEFIESQLKECGLEVTVGATDTLQAGPVEHLHTPISAKGDVNPLRLASRLAPTPALSGSPRSLALEVINKKEPVDRELYGGFIGPWHSREDFTLFVNLRSGRIFKDSIRLHVGGGITLKSDPESEWIEIERKASTLSRFIKPDQHHTQLFV